MEELALLMQGLLGEVAVVAEVELIALPVALVALAVVRHLLPDQMVQMDQVLALEQEGRARPVVEMKVVEVQGVGNYALSFTFGDLHRTGIYQWEYLKELSAAAQP